MKEMTVILVSPVVGAAALFASLKLTGVILALL